MAIERDPYNNFLPREGVEAMAKDFRRQLEDKDAEIKNLNAEILNLKKEIDLLQKALEQSIEYRTKYKVIDFIEKLNTGGIK